MTCPPIFETREHVDDLPRVHPSEAAAWRYAEKHGHQVWEVIEYGPNAGERYLGVG